MNPTLLSALLELLKGGAPKTLFFPEKSLGVLLASGKIAGLRGEPPPELLEEELKATIPEKVLKRARATATVSGTSLLKVLEDLGFGANELEPLRLKAGATVIEKALLTPPDQVPFKIVPEPSPLSSLAGIPLFEPLVKALSQWDPQLLLQGFTRWGERRFSPHPELYSLLPETVQGFLKEGERFSSLKEYLRSSPLPPREALAYAILAFRLGWFPEREAGIGGEEKKAQGETPGKGEGKVPLTSREKKDAPSLPDLQTVAVEVAAPPPSKPSPSPPPEPRAPHPPFYHASPPANLYARLGIPEGTTGQGVTQAYSRRLMEIRKALERTPGERTLVEWQEALLRAYRILTHPRALQLYEEALSQRKKGDAHPKLDEQIFQRMGNLAWEEGLKKLAEGDRYAGVKLIQEALSWNPDLVQGWGILAVHTALGGGEEEVREALSLLKKALGRGEDPYLYYLMGVLSFACGEEEGVQRARAFFEKHPEKAPPAWKEFLSVEVQG